MCSRDTENHANAFRAGGTVKLTEEPAGRGALNPECTSAPRPQNLGLRGTKEGRPTRTDGATARRARKGPREPAATESVERDMLLLLREDRECLRIFQSATQTVASFELPVFGSMTSDPLANRPVSGQFRANGSPEPVDDH